MTEIERIARRYPRVIRWSDEDACYIGTLPDLCGDCTDAPTAAAVADALDEIATDLVAHYLETQEPLPEPKRALKDLTAFTVGDIAKAIKRLREYRGLTQKDLAELLGCSLSTLIKWENGLRRPSGAAARLLAVLDNHPELVHGTELAETGYEEREDKHRRPNGSTPPAPAPRRPRGRPRKKLAE